jgi:hypothetical protein
MCRLQNNPSIEWAHPKSTHAHPLTWGNKNNTLNCPTMSQHEAQQNLVSIMPLGPNSSQAFWAFSTFFNESFDVELLCETSTIIVPRFSDEFFDVKLEWPNTTSWRWQQAWKMVCRFHIYLINWGMIFYKTKHKRSWWL